MIKVIAPAQHHPENRTLAAFHNYWGESHGPLFANTKSLRRYVQHLTLPESYGLEPAPTFDGVSMFWFDSLESQIVRTDDPVVLTLLETVLDVALTPEELRSQDALDDPEDVALLRAVLDDDAQLFDRSTSWPMHHKSACVAAEERVIVDGPAAPGMVKAIFIVGKLPGLTLDRFFRHWHDHHGALVARLPGLRRYVQNHAIPVGYVGRGQTHDGWSELWFDDLAALHNAVESAEWQAVREDGATLFTHPLGVGVARERVQKEFDWTYNDWGVDALSDDDVRQRLADDGYQALAADTDIPRQIKSAAAAKALAVWTSEHLVTIDGSRIDARPDR
jgi:uncharacterized protein (TIGR02118 family)